MRDVRLPEDDGVREDVLLQWWYWSGHLESGDGRAFGFEVSFFAGQVLADRVRGQMAQCAVTDIGGERFSRLERVWPAGPKVIPDAFDLAAWDGSVAAAGGGGMDTLHAEVEGYVLDLASRATVPATVHYRGRDHRYAFGGDSFYYSRPLLALEGTLALPTGEVLGVTGTGWFDRQFGELVPAVLVGWQWFAIQLEGGTEVMVFDFNDERPERYGSITRRDGGSQDLGPGDATVEVTRWWTSPHTGIRYPHGWRVTVPGHELVVTPTVDDQEMAGGFWIGPRYWEGACVVEGTARGRAYVELVGFRSGGLLAVHGRSRGA